MRATTAALAAVILMGGAGAAVAGNPRISEDNTPPHKGWLSPAQVKEKLGATHFSNVTKMQPEGDNYVGEGTENGEMHGFKVNGKTGEILDDHLEK